MKNFLQVGLMSAILLGSIATAANAQGIFVRNHFDEGRHVGWYDRDRDLGRYDRNRDLGWYDRDRDFGWHDRDRAFGMHRFGVASGEIVSFNNRVADLRNDIARRMSRGIIGPNEATRLNMRLDRLVALENRFQATGGGISPSEMASLNARLSDTRVAVMGSGRWF